MNIKKAKEQISNTVKAYLAKDEYGRYVIPQNKQRPLFLMGPPGIGKTEIMSQIASELGIGLLSYSMTHHTRQSAIGLPIIKKKEYNGIEFDASEYTMSEIISAVYDMMKHSGLENGILFLDEINCISETLTPIMLQFLQYKVFGGHKLPEGWVVVTAGNPPEYNSSVREFDIATWDRLKRIDIEPDFGVWKEFAYSSGIHNAVLTYLEIKPGSFYKIETAVNGKNFVTARGWDDLSRMIGVYENLGIETDTDLVLQYIQNKQVAEDFALYYELYRKYKSDYKVSDILSGKADENIVRRAANAKFDERYSLLGLLIETVSNEAKAALERDELLTLIKDTLKEIKIRAESGGDVADLLNDNIAVLEKERERLGTANNLSAAKDDLFMNRRAFLMRYRNAVLAGGGFDRVKAAFEEDISAFKVQLADTGDHFSGLFGFCEKAFGNGQELLILVTELAANPITARYISAFGCDEYYRHDKSLMFHERRLEIIEEIDKLVKQTESL